MITYLLVSPMHSPLGEQVHLSRCIQLMPSSQRRSREREDGNWPTSQWSAMETNNKLLHCFPNFSLSSVMNLYFFPAPLTILLHEGCFSQLMTKYPILFLYDYRWNTLKPDDIITMTYDEIFKRLMTHDEIQWDIIYLVFSWLRILIHRGDLLPFLFLSSPLPNYKK